MDRAEIVQKLERRLRDARMWRAEASAAFDAATNGFHGRIPTADSMEQIKSTSDEYGRSLLAIEKALREHNEFVMSGKLPVDVENAAA